MPEIFGPQTEAADNLHAMKYRSPGEDFRESMNRVAFGLKDNDSHYHELRNILLHQRFCPGGRIQGAIGASRQTTSFNCFVSGTIADTFVDGQDSIMGRAKEAAATMRMGGGIGYDFSTLRPRGDVIRKLQSQSSGPVSFMHIYDAVCLATSSSGHRRGAQMGMLRVDHPDIEEFLRAKQNKDKLLGFNISIAVTDSFMEAVIRQTSFELKFRDEVYATIDAAELWEKIMRSTWDYAEPGVIFIDTINRMNNLWYCETIAATNPCFGAGTLIVTDNGAKPIETLIGQTVRVYNGVTWETVDNFRITGTNQPMVKITMHDGAELRVTPAHRMVLEDGKEIQAKELQIGDKLYLSDIAYAGNIAEPGAYLKGFLIGDGSLKHGDVPVLYLYDTKYSCKSRLISSATEIPEGNVNTNAIRELGFVDHHDHRYTRCIMTGLAPRKTDLTAWCDDYKQGLPVEIFSWDYNSKAEFIAGLFDADGSVMDTTNGFGYQISSVYQKFLLDLQTLLKTIGVRSKVSLNKSSEVKTIKDGEYYCRDLFRLTISQTGAITLAQRVSFSRLKSIADYETKYNLKPRAGKVVKIEDAGVDPVVYCCTVNSNHRVTLGIGIVTGQCGEQPLPPFGACLLGSFNLVKYLRHRLAPAGQPNYTFDFQQLAADIPAVVRGMDNVIDKTLYPLAEQRAEALSKRRMGLGVMGLANAIEACGHLYGSPEFLSLQAEILNTINVGAYEASTSLAREKGPFPLYDEERFLQGNFIKQLPESTRAKIKEFGIRNSHLTSIAPTGTISLSADNVSGGVEPVFSYELTRQINTPTGPKMVTVQDYGAGFLNTRGKLTSEVSASEHVAVLSTAQRYIDSAVSKTINMTGAMPWADFKNIYRSAWESGCKGCTTFNSDGKRMALLVATDDSAGEKEPVTSCLFDPETGQKDCG